MPPIPLRGYIEGYYGKAHSHAERLRLLAFMGRHGLNAYMYAPKDDPLHREHWDSPYPAAERKRFAELLRASQRNNINFIYAISPGLFFRYADPRDFAVLLRKLRTIQALGFRHFALLLDDINSQNQARLNPAEKRIYSRPGLAHANLANRLLIGLGKGNRLFFCPTEYCTAMAKPSVTASPYLRDLAALDPAITVFWTGPWVVSKTITGPVLREINQVLGRKVIIWDNFHANDYSPSRLYLGPLTGRNRGTAKNISGYMANMTQDLEINLIPLATVAAYTRSPGAYRPEPAWDAYVRTAEKAAFPAVRLLRDFYADPFHYGPRARLMMQKLQRGTYSDAYLAGLQKEINSLAASLRNRELFNQLYRYIADLNVTLKLLRTPFMKGADREFYTSRYLTYRPAWAILAHRVVQKQTGFQDPSRPVTRGTIL
jgi:protein O-GlcNAcase/histone acetyltransferase